MLSNGVGRIVDTNKIIRKSSTPIGGVRTIALTAVGSGMIALMPLAVGAQTRGAEILQQANKAEIAQVAEEGVTLSNDMLSFDISAQPLAMALVNFSRVSGIDVAVDGTLPDGTQSVAVQGNMTAGAALDRMLSQSGLIWNAVNPTTISIIDPVREDAGNASIITVPVTVTATERALGPNGVPDKVYETPGSVAVITQESMRKSPVREAREIFNNVAGVDISNDARDPGLTVNVRGQQEMGRVNVNIDGARQNYNQMTHGTSSRVYLDPALLAEVEIEKSNLNQNGGAGSSAGIVTMRTLNTQDILDDGEKWGGKVNVSHGTNDYEFAGDAAGGVRLAPRFDISAAVSRKVIGDYSPGKRNPALFTDGNGNYHDVHSSRPEYTFLRQTSGLVKANVHLTDDQELNLGYVGSKSNYTKTNDVTNTRPDLNETKTHTLTAKHNWNPSTDLVDLDTHVYWTRTESNQYRPTRFNTSGSVSQNPYDTDYTLDTTGLDLANSSKFELYSVGDGLSKVSFDYGTEFFHDRAKTTSEVEDLGGSGSAYQAEGTTPSGERDVYGGHVTATYGWNDVVQISGGFRYDRYELTGDSYWCEALPGGFTSQQCGSGNDVPLDVDLSEDRVSPSFGASVTPFPGLQFFANYRENLRAPTVMEAMFKGMHIGDQPVTYFSNANLKAEEVETKEVGVNFMFDNVIKQGDGFRAKLSYYRSTIDNYTTVGFVPLPSLPSVNWPSVGAGMVNLSDPVYMTGTELEAFYDAGEYYFGGTLTTSDIDLIGNYNQFILDTTYSTAAQNAATYGTVGGLFGIYAPPKRKYTLDGGFRLFDQDLVLGMRATFVYPEENYGSQVGSVSLSTVGGEYYKYRVFDFYSSYDINDAVKLRFAVNNLFDEGYVQGSGGTYAPAPGRTAIISLSGNF